MLTKLLIKIAGNALGIFLSAYLIAGVKFDGLWPDPTLNGLLALLGAAAVLTMINFFIKPILKIVSAPLIVLTLGLFTIIINIIMLWFLTLLIPELTITGFLAYLWTTVIVSAINLITRG